MKELSIQEKSERYDMAIERAKGLIDFSSDSELKTLEYVFPELRESEDEKIRKDLIKWFKEFPDTIWRGPACQYSHYKKDVISWLEKQSKPININPSEFDLHLNKLLKQFESLSKEELISSLSFYLNVVQNNGTYKEEKQREKPQGKSALEAIKAEKVDNANKVEPTDYNSIDPHFGKPVDKAEPKFKVGDWCIDNEDGTIFQIVKVLDKTYRYRTNEGKEYSCARYSLELDARFWTISDAKEGDVLVDSLGNVCIYQEPSTKLMYHSHCYGNHKFFIPMSGSHEIVGSYPATKEQRDQLGKVMADAGYVFDFEKKELKEIENEEYDGEDYGIDSLWHAKNILEKTLGKVDGYQTDDGILDHKCAISFIDKLYKQKPAEWSEEDESNFQGIIDVIKENKQHVTTDYEHMKYYKLLSWFKSLKDRYVWKPSEEQIKILSTYANVNDVLASLYQDLKKLM